jgi:hypothetical protein
MNLPVAAVIAIALIGSGRTASAAQTLSPPWLPADPGKAQCRIADGGAELSNGVLRFVVRADGKSVKPSLLENRFVHRAQVLDGELFVVTPGGGKSPRGGKSIGASEFALTGDLSCVTIAAKNGLARAAERRNGVALKGEFQDRSTGIRAAWRAVLRDGTNYVREEVEFAADADIDLASITLLDLQLEKSWIAGTAEGSPLIAGDNFYGFEHPMSSSQIEGGHATAKLRRLLPLRVGVAEKYSAVLGVAPHGQLRRGFQAYLENERAAPFRTFLHYNSWYDIGYFEPYTQAAAVGAIDAMGQKLVKDRGVLIDSFLFDDGWDDHNRLWQFSSEFPNGFAPVRAAAEKYGAEPGIWLSPWGGYDGPRAQRLAAAKAGGYEVDDQGLALSGQKYYPLFHDITVNLLKTYKINQFKLDGTGSPDKVTPGSKFDSDFAAAIALALIGDLRAIKPDLFINLTTGTWPSPFWLRTADSIWRGGEDYGFAGVGSDRQRWITYRDGDMYGGIVRLGTLFPLNSLMLHGIIYARAAPNGLNVDPYDDFADEVHDYFATGTGLQELYISAHLLSDRDWDTLADAAKWARRHAETLRDSHWIGGDPMRLDVYGWASWSPSHAIVALRNPSDRPQTFTLDLAAALELPEGAPSAWNATPAFAAGNAGIGAAGVVAGNARELQTGAPIIIELKAFEVLVWDLAPARAN